MSKTVFSCRALPHLVHALAALEKNLTAVKNGFKRAGIYPPDPDAINYDACAPSKKGAGVFERPGQTMDKLSVFGTSRTSNGLKIEP